jgi:hypothetical protein
MDDRRFAVIPVVGFVSVTFDATQQAPGVVAHVLVEATVEERHSAHEFDGLGPCPSHENVPHAFRRIVRLRRNGSRMSDMAIGFHGCRLAIGTRVGIQISRPAGRPSAFLIRRERM